MAIKFRLFQLARLLLLAVLMSPAGAAQETPKDPVTGMAIPMLPGQFYVKSPSGCWMISDEALGYTLNSYQFIGSCTFGVVNGLGFRAPVQNEYHPQPPQSYEYWPFRAKLGEVWGLGANKWDVYAPRTSTHDLLEMMNLPHREIPPASQLFQAKAGEVGEVLATYQSWKNRVLTEQSVQVRRQACPSWAVRIDWLTLNGGVVDYIGRGDMQKEVTEKGLVAKADAPRLVDFCMKQVALLKKEFGGRKTDFIGLSYGYYFVATTYTSSYTLSADGRYNVGQQVSQTSKGCPDLGTLTGCEPVWQAALAPFVSRFDDLKRKEVALFAQHSSEQQQRFAPLVKAWRDKILLATGDAPAGKN